MLLHYQARAYACAKQMLEAAAAMQDPWLASAGSSWTLHTFTEHMSMSARSAVRTSTYDHPIAFWPVQIVCSAKAPTT